MKRQEALGVLNFYRNLHYSDALGTEERELADAINEVLPTVANLTVNTEQPQKWQVIGQRIYGSGRCYTHYCPVCMQHGYDDYLFCPSCGTPLSSATN